MTEGDAADSCFVICAGKCDILVLQEGTPSVSSPPHRGPRMQGPLDSPGSSPGSSFVISRGGAKTVGDAVLAASGASKRAADSRMGSRAYRLKPIPPAGMAPAAPKMRPRSGEHPLLGRIDASGAATPPPGTATSPSGGFTPRLMRGLTLAVSSGRDSPEPIASPLAMASPRGSPPLMRRSEAAGLAPSASAAPPKTIRHVATLGAGALVGELALLGESETRIATVRAATDCHLLALNRSTFQEFDRQTLDLITERAAYNAACIREPAMRSDGDLASLVERTQALTVRFGRTAHRELCRRMVFRRVSAGELLVRRGAPAATLFILLSGSVHTYTSLPQESTAQRWAEAAAAALGEKAPPAEVPDAEAFACMVPSETLQACDVVGEPGVESRHSRTAIALTATEVMELSQADFAHIEQAEAERIRDQSRLREVLANLPELDGIPAAALQRLANLVTMRVYPRGQLCFAHPPEQALGSASASTATVCVILRGEARVRCICQARLGGPNSSSLSLAAGASPPHPAALALASEPGGVAVASGSDLHAPTAAATAAAAIDSSAKEYGLRWPHGPQSDQVPPPSSLVERHLGEGLRTVATLGQGEVIVGNLYSAPSRRWCLQPLTPLEVLAVPRDAWQETVRPAQLAWSHELAAQRAAFLEGRLESIQAALGDTLSPRDLRERAAAALRHDALVASMPGGLRPPPVRILSNMRSPPVSVMSVSAPPAPPSSSPSSSPRRAGPYRYVPIAEPRVVLRSPLPAKVSPSGPVRVSDAKQERPQSAATPVASSPDGARLPPWLTKPRSKEAHARVHGR